MGLESGDEDMGAGPMTGRGASAMRMAQVQATADNVLARCERVLVPAAEAPPLERGSCFRCGNPSSVRISMREDGTEMFWVNACDEHQHDEVRVTVSEW